MPLKQEIIDALKNSTPDGNIEFDIDKYNISDLCEKDTTGADAAYIAAKNGNVVALGQIINKIRSQPEEQATTASLWHLLTDKDINGKIILHTAVMTPNNDLCIKALLGLVAELTAGNRKTKLAAIRDYLNLPDSAFGSTALHFASQRLNLQNMMSLKNAGASYHVASTPLHPDAAAPKKPWELVLFETTNLDEHAKCLQFYATWMYQEHDKESLGAMKTQLREKLPQARKLIQNNPSDTRAQQSYFDLRAKYMDILNIHVDWRRIVWGGDKPTISAIEENNVHNAFMQTMGLQEPSASATPSTDTIKSGSESQIKPSGL